MSGHNQIISFADAVRPLGPIAAWGVGCFAGWKVWQSSDLLTSALRGAGAWLAVMVIWKLFISLCDTLAGPEQMQGNSDPRTPEQV